MGYNSKKGEIAGSSKIDEDDILLLAKIGRHDQCLQGSISNTIRKRLNFVSCCALLHVKVILLKVSVGVFATVIRE